MPKARGMPGGDVKASICPIHKFQAAEKYLSPAEPDCTCRIHQHKFADHDITLWVPVTPSFCLVCHGNASETTSSADIILRNRSSVK